MVCNAIVVRFVKGSQAEYLLEVPRQSVWECQQYTCDLENTRKGRKGSKQLVR